MNKIVEHILFDIALPTHSLQREMYLTMITMVMVQWCGRREPMAVLPAKFSCRYPSLANSICDYAEGKIPPHYPVPAVITKACIGPPFVVIYSLKKDGWSTDRIIDQDHDWKRGEYPLPVKMEDVIQANWWHLRYAIRW